MIRRPPRSTLSPTRRSSDLRTLLAEQLGLALSEMAATQKYPVVVRTEIDYRRAAKLGDRLTIEGWLDQLERVRFSCARSEEHTSELQSQSNLVCRLLLEKKK